MGDAYPEITKNPDFIRKALQREEETFLRTRDRGMKILDDLMTQARDRGDKTIPGEEAFKLWDTYGFPVDLTVEVAGDDGIAVDMDGYTAAMKAHKDEAKKAWKGAKIDFGLELLDELHEQHGATEFVGYDNVGPFMTEVIAFIHKGSISATMKAGEEGLVVLRQTPFYSESGGQVGDSGVIQTSNGLFTVTDTQKSPHGIVIHQGRVTEGEVKVPDKALARVDAERREAIKRNHSSVHLLQRALKKIVGDHVTQAGSWVGPNGSRFDFTHTEALGNDQLRELQREVNRLVIRRMPVTIESLAIEDARSVAPSPPSVRNTAPWFAWSAWVMKAWNSAAAPMWPIRGKSSTIGSSARRASRAASAASRPSPAPRRWRPSSPTSTRWWTRCRSCSPRRDRRHSPV
jgi:alanyl-tRNA synthetase